MIGREKEIEDIEKAISKTYNVLITGPIGIGKHLILREMKTRYKNNVCFYLHEPALTKPFLGVLAKKLGYYSIADKHKLVNEIEKRAMESKKPVLLFLNNLHDISKQDSKIILRLIRTQKILVIGSCIKNISNKELAWAFKEKIELNPLSRKHSEQLIKKQIKLNKNQLRQTLFKTKGMPLAIADIVDDLKHTRAEVDDIKPHPCIEARRIDLFPLIGFFAIAYVFLALRYIAILGDSRQLYIICGALGFIILSISRYVRGKQYGH